jgi:CRISPR/Cas system CSM-associated protein Csm3 (group 7 of RAMP superfamily)
MAIASGQMDTKTVKPRNKPETEQTYTQICLDAGGRPYIPASSLRGLLRDLCSADLPGFKNLEGLFKTEEGVLRFYDAVWHSENKPYPALLHTRNKINQRTGTAQDMHLYSHAYVPADSRFICQIEADNISQAQLQDLLGLLNGLDANPFSQLGKHQSKQQGLIKWQEKQVEVLEQENLINWLLDESVSSALPFDKLGSMTGSPLRTASHTPPLSCFVCTFIPQSPILINDPNLVLQNDDEHKPDLEFYRKGSQLMIPSSSLMGVMRGQCRKILLTLLMAKEGVKFDNAKNKADKFLGKLFGCTGQRSRVWLTDAIATNTAPHLQMFTAIDRFTGGVKDGALYKANAATATEITTTLYLDQTQQALEAWQKGLLVLLLRDAMEGDLKVGWGKSKGYGVLSLNSIAQNAQKRIKNWTDWLNQKDWQPCLTALLEELEK